MKGTETSLNQSNNGHRVEVHAISVDGVSFSEKELRSIEEFLEQRGFRVYVDVKRVSILEKMGLRLFGK